VFVSVPFDPLTVSVAPHSGSSVPALVMFRSVACPEPHAGPALGFVAADKQGPRRETRSVRSRRQVPRARFLDWRRSGYLEPEACSMGLGRQRDSSISEARPIANPPPGLRKPSRGVTVPRIT
jgi:hypothetical protein